MREANRTFGHVFPARNLGAGEDWGRSAEERIQDLEGELLKLTQVQSNDGRSLNARTDAISSQLLMLSAQQEALQVAQEELEIQQRELSVQQSQLDAQQESLLMLVSSLPRNDGFQERSTGWSIDTAPVGGSWTTVATGSVSVPNNMTRVAVTAWGNASATSSNVYESAMQARIVVSGTGSPEVEGMMETLASTVRSSVHVAFFREFSVVGASSVTVNLQVRGRYDDFSATNVANLTVGAGFTAV